VELIVIKAHCSEYEPIVDDEQEPEVVSLAVLLLGFSVFEVPLTFELALVPVSCIVAVQYFNGEFVSLCHV